MVRRTYTYITFGVGLLIIIGGALKFIPGGVGTGAALALLGLVLFGLSFVPPPAPTEGAPAPLPALPFMREYLVTVVTKRRAWGFKGWDFSETGRILGMFFEPSRVFKNLRYHPRWLAPLLVIALLTFAYTTAFTQRLTPERIVNFTVDKVAEQFTSIPPEQVARMREDQVAALKSPVQLAGNAVKQFLSTFVALGVVAALAMLGVLLLGGRINFWQALSVVAHAALPAAIIDKVLSFVILYLKDPDTIHPVLGQGGLVTDNLGALFNPAENPVLFSAASAVGVLAFYRVWLLATGLRHGGERVTSGTGWAIAITFWLIVMLLSVAMSALFPQFIS